MNKQLKQARESLKLSIQFAASRLNITETELEAIENGTRKPTRKEMAGFSRLYGTITDDLCETHSLVNHPGLSDTDKKQIASLLAFRHRYTKTR